jgi:hypothetical protein
MIKVYIFSKPEYRTPDDCHGKLIWKGEIEVLPPIGYEIAIDGVVHSVERASYDVVTNIAEIHLDFKDNHQSYERLSFDH